MTVSDELWDAYSAATRALWEQQKQVCEALRKMADAILNEEITHPDEIDEILLEIYAFGHHYSPALDLYKEMRRHIRQKHPAFWRGESPIIRAIFEGDDDIEEMSQ